LLSDIYTLRNKASIKQKKKSSIFWTAYELNRYMDVWFHQLPFDSPNSTIVRRLPCVGMGPRILRIVPWSHDWQERTYFFLFLWSRGSMQMDIRYTIFNGTDLAHCEYLWFCRILFRCKSTKIEDWHEIIYILRNWSVMQFQFERQHKLMFEFGFMPYTLFLVTIWKIGSKGNSAIQK